MKHFLLTRFNLKNKAWKKSEDAVHKGLTENWLNQRFDLFKTYCLPSVVNQSNQNFIWFLIFDIDTPLKFKTEINTVIKNQPNFKVIYADGFDQLLPSLKFHIKSHIEKHDDFIITTRLDNDDIIHKDFIKTIQKLYKPIDNLVIDLRKGYQMIIEGKIEIREFYDPYNPFISLVESTKKHITVLSKEHSNFNRNVTAINKKEYLWIQMVHSQNQANTKTSYLRRLRIFESNKYGINITLPEYSKLENIIFNLKRLPLRIFYSIKAKVKLILKA